MVRKTLKMNLVRERKGKGTGGGGYLVVTKVLVRPLPRRDK